jgi:hypothetical protein
MAAALALPVAGCGKAKPKIPRSDAQHLIALLRQADARAAKHSCTGLQATTLPDLQVQVEQLPANIDPDIRNTLRDGISNLRTLVTAQCATQTPKPKQTSTPSTTAPPPSTVTVPPTTNTAPPSTSTPPPSTSTPPPSTSTPPSTPSGGSPSGGKPKAKKK